MAQGPSHSHNPGKQGSPGLIHGLRCRLTTLHSIVETVDPFLASPWTGCQGFVIMALSKEASEGGDIAAGGRGRGDVD